MSKIIHQADLQQFICTVEGQESRVRYRQLDATTIEAYSTFVPPALRVQGIADELARALFDWATAQGLTIVPSCRYIEVWLRRNARP
ncbi:MAG: GNAT family N-acetyltransferase [Aeromonas sp.]